MDYTERQKPDVFKPAIDEALMRIARLAEADTDAVAAKLAEVEPSGGPWTYLNSQAVPAVRELLVNDRLRGALEYTWGMGLLDGSIDQYFESFSCVATQDEVEPGGWSQPVVLEYYPEESLECLRQELYVGGSDADVVALWKREDRTSICHAHMEGFWILGEDPIDWAENIAAKAEEKLAEA